MDRNEAIDILRVIAPPRTSKKAFYDFMEARDMAIAALEAYVPDKNVGDMISRQAAIDAIVNTVSEIGLHDNSEVARYGATFRQHEIIDIIKGMPPAQPKRGKWIHHEGGYSDHYECTACGKAIVLTGRWKFCPNCGADMRCSENPNS